ncbi:LuxR C-terminal-related transcriptional regulator [Homoserinibacter sp. YIM 151385]|uniref:LuxR C-terminal-related transcriptional regulator n=1 Tax=Homoserinibacter sp. YIM 151385 TaxID=2985506 RepID=UPI0022F0423F|nr:LuxR C-terminal-related transcriptional regulator [Homoserinibacter sp. YIM 151385]WBU37526.1 LuxR C-terminal-related transcriptional regulator [Homoserinibacter sp. YIM 151385]
MTGLVFVPRRIAGAIERPRLVDRLTAHDGALAIVRAPGGAGKTSLLVEWAASLPADRVGAWIALDASATTQTAFWTRVLETLRDGGIAEPGSVLGSITPSAEIADRLRAQILRGLNRLGTQLTLVLDDFHLVEDAVVLDDLEWLLANAPGLRVVIATRTLSRLEDPGVRARLDVLVIGFDELTFDADELARVSRGVAIEPARLRELHERVGGWPLATRAAIAELAEGGGDLDRVLARIRSAAVGADSLEGAPDSPLLDAALRLAVTPLVPEGLAAELGGPDAAEHLGELERAGIGGWRSLRGARVFAFHPLVREALREELARRRPRELAAVRRKAAEWLASDGAIFEAVSLAAELGDWELFMRLARPRLGTLLLTHRRELLALVERAPAGEAARNPTLAMLRVILVNALPTSTGRRLHALGGAAIAAARDRLSTRSSRTDAERLWLLVGTMGVQRILGRYEQSLGSARRALELVDRSGPAEVEALGDFAPTILLQLGSTFLYAGQGDTAADLASRAVELAEIMDRPWSAVHAEGLRTVVLATRGEVRAAREAVERLAARVRPEGWRHSYSGSLHAISEAVVALERFDTAAALDAVGRLAAHERTIEHWPMIASIRATASLMRGDLLNGEHALRRVMRERGARAGTSPMMRGMLLSVLADLLIARGDTARARRLLGPSADQPAARLALARVELLAGTPTRAAEAAGVLANDHRLSPRIHAEALLLSAAASARLAPPRTVGELLDDGLALTREHELGRPIMMVPRRALLDAFAAADRDPTGLLDGIPDVFGRDAPPQLTPRELEVLAALRSSPRIDDLAERLYVSSNTVKSQLRSAYRKLGASSRDQALAIAHRHGLLGDDD